MNAQLALVTAHEVRILAAVADGLTTDQVAQRYGVSSKTIMHQLGAIHRKLQASNRTHAIAIAFRAGLLR